MAVTSDTTLRRDSEVRYVSTDANEVALLNIATCKFYALNAVGSRIWQLLERPMTVGQLCARICQEFDIDVRTCEAAVLKFADEIIGIGIVDTSEN